MWERSARSFYPCGKLPAWVVPALAASHFAAGADRFLIFTKQSASSEGWDAPRHLDTSLSGEHADVLEDGRAIAPCSPR
jgi:hypothetical protein